MNQIVTNRSKMQLAINLKGGKSLHLRPQESGEVSEEDCRTSEFIKHVTRGRLEVKGMKKQVPSKPGPTTKKVASPAPPADDKPKDAGN